jgi:hypothetical protein
MNLHAESEARKRMIEASTPAVPRYGFRCVLERLQRGAIVREEFYQKGASPSQPRARAEVKNGFIRIVELAPLTRAEWDRAHNGRNAARDAGEAGLSKAKKL